MTARRRLLLPALSTALMVAVLCALGLWQVRRLHWKTGLLAAIDAAEQAPAVPLPVNPEPFQKVRVSGRLLPGTGRYGTEARPWDGAVVLGSQVVALVQPAAGPPIVTLLGWLPDATAFASPPDSVAFDAYVRSSARPGWFTPPDDAAARRFYTLDPAAIGPALGAATVAPFALVRLGPSDGAAAPVPATALPRPPNDHLQYAITWFALAATLLVVFAAYVRKAAAA